MPNDVTVSQILQRINAGDADAHGELFTVVYDELRRRAELFMAAERADHTLQPTALVNEAFLRLVGSVGRNGAEEGGATRSWSGSEHFYNAVAEAMRRILVDHARRRNAAKRAGPRTSDPDAVEQVACADAERREAAQDLDFEALDLALHKLKAEDERRYHVVMYRYFAAMPETQIAQLLGVSEKTVQRDWQTAKMFLFAELTTP